MSTMKPLVVIFSFLFCSVGFGQVPQHEEVTDSLNQEGLPHFKLREPTGYLLNKQEFTFTPEVGGIRLEMLQDEKKVDFGDLRRTTPDGLYIMTSTINEDISFGRFDSLGNFRTLRYDREKDSVLEYRYMIQNEEKEDEPEN